MPNGSATDVPELLRGLLADDAQAREIALDGLYGAVHHQGDIYDRTIACVIFLLQAVADVQVPDRGGILARWPASVAPTCTTRMTPASPPGAQALPAC